MSLRMIRKSMFYVQCWPREQCRQMKTDIVIIFFRRVRCNEQLCSMVIDGGSCTNVISEDACKKLGLKTEPHLAPYKVTWVNDTNLKVNERCLLTPWESSWTSLVWCPSHQGMAYPTWTALVIWQEGLALRIPKHLLMEHTIRFSKVDVAHKSKIAN